LKTLFCFSKFFALPFDTILEDTVITGEIGRYWEVITDKQGTSDFDGNDIY
jgi:hypothetical protein